MGALEGVLAQPLPRLAVENGTIGIGVPQGYELILARAVEAPADRFVPRVFTRRHQCCSLSNAAAAMGVKARTELRPQATRRNPASHCPPWGILPRTSECLSASKSENSLKHNRMRRSCQAP